MPFHERPQSAAHDCLMAGQILGLNDNAGADQRDLLQVAEEIETGPLQLSAENTGDGGSLDRAGFQGLADDSLIAEGGNRDFISFRVQTDLFQSQHRRHPAGAADAGDTDAFSF